MDESDNKARVELFALIPNLQSWASNYYIKSSEHKSEVFIIFIFVIIIFIMILFNHNKNNNNKNKNNKNL